MRIAIVGFGLEGQSSYKYFAQSSENEITVCDQDESLQLPEGAASKLGNSYLDDLSGFDLIVRTSGLPPVKILEKNPGVGDKITTQLNIFLKVCPTLNLIGVTGTKGKGTTSSLIAAMIEAGGKHVVLCGNIGIPMLDTLSDITADSYVVLELSSFQLIDLRENSPRIAVCLMVVPEHLNWHDSLEDYIKAKTQLFSHQSPGDVAIYYADNELSRQITVASPGEHVSYMAPPGAIIQDERVTIEGQYICDVSAIKLLGAHNLQNVCAAVTAAWQVFKHPAALRSVLESFTGLPHRLELIAEIDGVKYYDDSFGTTPETAAVAIAAFKEPVVLIAGGSDKGSNYTPMVSAITGGNVTHVICIGHTGPAIASMLDAHAYERKVDYTLISPEENSTMAAIVAAARQHAQSGGVVLLSTGCASFDLFKNYKDRGEQFKQAVQSLAPAA